MDGWMDGWMHGWMHGWTDRLMDGWIWVIETRKLILCFFVLFCFFVFFVFYFIKISKFALPGVMLIYERTSKDR